MATAGGRELLAATLHADLDAFYASVEQRDDPGLRGRPVLVGGGVVMAASYEAKRRGVRTPMGLAQARRLCPDAVVLPPRIDAYSRASRQVFAIFDDTTPLVEPISVDEAFLDVSGLAKISGSPRHVAETLRARVREEVGLPISIGIASSKFLAKVASAVSKPDGLLEVTAGSELDFLHPLPVSRLWGVGAITERKLAEQQIFTIGDLAAQSEHRLSAVVGGAAGSHLHALAHANDPRRVRTGVRRKSIGAQRALGARSDPASLQPILIGLIERVCHRLRGADRRATGLVLRLRFGDFGRATRSRTFAVATDATEVIMAAGLRLLSDASELIGDRGCTLIGISLSGLDDHDTAQPTLPFDGRDRPELDAAVDQIRRKWGTNLISRGVNLGQSAGMEVPLLPD